ncbi:Ctr copper transporter family-domain-containing protein [Tricharina praecox]|uniref:Ctr copper transporter family-domain-containing protein n=1 Tax=Tricharina praecox TaxID=43433 RepID=UPI00221F9074|nr:Ctr copper transporter family-domain-containing protein [Tricharina praecox]KAI5846065.1 Ctr copper transporter family-domain-containing protein [Tricharina praecox]
MADFTQNTSSGSSSSSSSTSTTSSSSSDSMSDSMSMTMSMTFITSTTTPLFSTSWTPRTLGQYVGACIFLIVLAFVFRFVLAWKAVLEHRWARREVDRKPVVVLGDGDAGGSEDELPKEAGEGEGGWAGRPWRFGTELPRAAMAVLSTGLGYLLMLAVMTMNVGYFMSVLAGVFVGELAWGRFMTGSSH